VIDNEERFLFSRWRWYGVRPFLFFFLVVPVPIPTGQGVKESP